jgi:hypothetical protein
MRQSLVIASHRQQFRTTESIAHRRDGHAGVGAGTREATDGAIIELSPARIAFGGDHHLWKFRQRLFDHVTLVKAAG